MTRALFITGTDTGVGKTLVGRILCAAAHGTGLRVAPFKPFESGCARDPAGTLLPADALALRAACGLDHSTYDIHDCNLYAFSDAIAPGNAAQRAGTMIDQRRVLRAWTNLRARFELLIVEGAGGLLVPLSERLLVADLAARLGAPLLIVARDALGTINHTLLTVSEARRRGLHVAGVVLSRAAPEVTPDGEHNAREISRLGDVVVFGTLPFVNDADRLAPDRLAAFAARSLDVAAILRAAA
jgi:dethiobiotin synthetase